MDISLAILLESSGLIGLKDISSDIPITLMVFLICIPEFQLA